MPFTAKRNECVRPRAVLRLPPLLLLLQLMVVLPAAGPAQAQRPVLLPSIITRWKMPQAPAHPTITIEQAGQCMGRWRQFEEAAGAMPPREQALSAELALLVAEQAGLDAETARIKQLRVSLESSQAQWTVQRAEMDRRKFELERRLKHDRAAERDGRQWVDDFNRKVKAVNQQREQVARAQDEYNQQVPAYNEGVAAMNGKAVAFNEKAELHRKTAQALEADFRSYQEACAGPRELVKPQAAASGAPGR